ncbi:A disintegrin and metalloproteinase with thrombospondin motifs 17-like isoform X1 [Gordionus sp. m RMFG-2023]|uniref:A disintegrin and metalloproteinase with thrombospondin motifs 17-like isoform X1 n=1 Tax=Gordionus sp. m RMFG-2023 TaxID=3053472 RepID=UPI0031FCDBEF
MHYDSTYPRKYQWSSCSVQDIDNYLGYEGKCLENADSYREAPSFFVSQLDLHKACRSWGLDLDLKNSSCTDLKCTAIGRFDRDLPQLLDFLPCNQLSNNLSSSQTGICYKGNCILKKRLQEKAGSWSSWSSWSKCRGDDTIGFAKRTRKCNNPRPKFGGRYCQGAKIEYKVCEYAVIFSHLAEIIKKIKLCVRAYRL